MELNYEKKYAYVELECILNWLGEEYKNKIPKRILQIIKREKRYSYQPQIDFSKPLENQIRQETKNMIAYLNCKYWLQGEKEKIREAVQKNAELQKERKRMERRKEIQMRAEFYNRKKS